MEGNTPVFLPYAVLEKEASRTDSERNLYEIFFILAAGAGCPAVGGKFPPTA